MLAWIIKESNLEGFGYAEPFAGGAGAAITLLLNGTVREIWLNDFDYAIYSFWKSILDQTDSFIDLVEKTEISTDEWAKQKSVYIQQPKDILKLGFATFFLNRCNRAGILSANPIGGLKQDGKYKLNARFKKEALIKKIEKIAENRNRIHVFNLDAKDFILYLQKTKQKILVYFDPPYYKKGELLYLNHFRVEDHVELRNRIVKCKLPWLLSYDDDPSVRDLYKKFPTYRRRLRYSISKPSLGNELIISKLKLPETLEKINAK